MKRSKLFIATILALLVGFSGCGVFTSESVVDAEKDFAIENTDEVYKVFLAGKDGNTALLERKDDHWMLNEQYKAMQPKMDRLLETMSSLVVKYKVTGPKLDVALKDLAVDNIKVELYKKDETAPFKTYFVGSKTTDNDGTYMLMKLGENNAENVYVLGLNGFVGDIRYHYVVKEDEWRDLGIFDHKADDIAMVELEYFDYPSSSFRIHVDGPDQFRMNPFNGDEMVVGKKLSQIRLRNYLHQFEFKNAETVDNDYPGRDSIIEAGVALRVKLLDKQGNQSILEVYKMPTNKRTKQQFNPDGSPVPYDHDRYFAIYNNGRDFGVIQHFVFGKIFRRLHEFYDPDPT